MNESSDGALHNPDAEKALLGALLTSPDILDDILDVVKPSDFFTSQHAEVFAAITRVRARNIPVDPVTVLDQMSSDGVLLRVGGAPFLHDLTAAMTVTASTGYYVDIVRGLATKRAIDRIAGRLAQAARSAASVTDIVDDAQRALAGLVTADSAAECEPMATLFDQAISHLEAIEHNGGPLHGVASGLPDLDRKTYGFHPGQLCIVGARPAQGKSLLGLLFARQSGIAERGMTMLFSLEMSAMEVTMRTIAAEAGVPLDAMNSGKLTDRQWASIANTAPRVAVNSLLIDPTASQTVAAIRAKARRVAATSGLKLIVVDYLQLMEKTTRAENRQVAVDEFARQLKLLAKDLNVPVIAMAQLNRAPDARANGEPVLSDLRESGGIEAHADVVMLLHHDKPDPATGHHSGEVHIILAKNRNGPTGRVSVAWQPHLGRVAPMATV